MHVLVAGLGWLGAEVAARLVAGGHRVTGVRRSGRAAPGVPVVRADLGDPSTAGRLPAGLDAIVACQAAGEASEAAYRRAYVDANRTLLDHARRTRCGAFVYTGSTGVFGHSDGREVVEETPVRPSGTTAGILVEAESLVLAAADRGDVQARVVRLSGLYGPNRIGVIDRVRTGRLALGPGDDAWTNWCHLDDALSCVLLAIEKGEAGGVYHGTDGTPLRRAEVVRWIASRLSIEPPSASASAERAGGRRRANRRVLGPRTRERLGFEPRWRSLREGLAPFLPSP